MTEPAAVALHAVKRGGTSLIGQTVHIARTSFSL